MRDPYRQDTHGTVAANGFHRLGVQVNLPFREPCAVSHPFLHARHIAFTRSKTGAHPASGTQDQVSKHVVALTVGNDDLDAFVGHLAGYGTFSHHPAASETGFLRTDILLQIPFRFHLTDNLHARFAGKAVVYAIHIAQYD